MKSILSAATLLATLAVSGGVGAQGLVHARQVIFGMDCAPCAYGVEKGLKRLPGVQSVTVSLNDGYTEVALAPDSGTSLADIRQVIRHSGFTPKDAQVQLEGALQLSPQPHLTTPKGVYALQFGAAGAPAAPLQGRTVAIYGSVASDSTAVRVTRVDPIGSPKS
ncbi:MAG: hypothetical protein ABT19_02745 [Rhodanobacter sp. SCN 68-63]|nr:MAG: hypothetical protein ABT19_02745 [Rhodanobacter sp. SCN 68-63]